MAGLLTYSGFRGLPILLINGQWQKWFENSKMELTAAGLFRIFTGFPFHHLSEQIGEPMRGKDTKKYIDWF